MIPAAGTLAARGVAMAWPSGLRRRMQRTPMRLPRLVLSVLAAAVLVSASLSVLPAQEQDNGFASQHKAKDAARGKLQARKTSIVDVVDKVKAAVVNIHSERLVQGQTPQELLALAPSQNRINGMGTGIIIDPRGYIVTNHHVVEEVNFIRIKLYDGTSVNAQVVARNHEQDLALLKIEVPQKLQVMPLGTAADVMVGETVVAIGNAYGYEHTVSMGVVSAVKRDVSLNKDISYKSLIQTDASINPGNSGGPLLNINGELIGVNVAIRAGAQGIGFAIPVDTMIRVVSEMLKARYRQVTCDGLVVRDKLESTTEGVLRSVVIDRVEPGTPAAAANLQKGDVVVAVGDVPVCCTFDVDRGLLDHQPNDRLAVVVKRAGSAQEQKVELVLEAADRSKSSTVDLVWKRLGVKLNPISGEVVSRVNKQLHGGLEVVTIVPEGAASRAGIKKGDIIVGLHQWETLTLDNIVYVLTHPDLASFSPLSFYIIRTGQVRRGYIQQLD
jgi:serine protease Do